MDTFGSDETPRADRIREQGAIRQIHSKSDIKQRVTQLSYTTTFFFLFCDFSLKLMKLKIGFKKVIPIQQI